MLYLVDTSVLVRSVHRGDPRRHIARNAVRTLRGDGHRLCILPQNVAEFWAVCTRPASSNGLGYSADRTRRYIASLEPMFEFFYETAEVYQEWRRLLDKRDIPGRQIHDARLAAAITVHGLDQVLTFDTTHFSRFRAISVVDPASVAAT